MPRQQHILVVDGTNSGGGELDVRLSGNGFQVTQVETACQAMQDVDTTRYDIIIIEARLPDLDGWELCTLLRRSGFQRPLLILGNAADPDDVVRGLSAGADDYLVRPCPTALLLARLRAHTRSYQTNSEATQDVGTLQFSPRKRAVTNAGISRAARLTRNEAALFGFLYRAEGEPLDRGQLIRDIWGEVPDLQSHAVEAMIYRLRQKIEPNPSKPAFLLKVSQGYCLVDPSTRPPGRVAISGASPESSFRWEAVTKEHHRALAPAR